VRKQADSNYMSEEIEIAENDSSEEVDEQCVDPVNKENSSEEVDEQCFDPVDKVQEVQINNGIEHVETSCPSELPNDFLEFEIWLTSADRGKKCSKSAKQHAYQVSVILKAIDKTERKVSSLWSKTSLKTFLRVYVIDKQLSPKTIKTIITKVIFVQSATLVCLHTCRGT